MEYNKKIDKHNKAVVQTKKEIGSSVYHWHAGSNRFLTCN